MADRWGRIGKTGDSVPSSRSAHWDRSSTLMVGESDIGGGAHQWQISAQGPAPGATPLPWVHSSFACPVCRMIDLLPHYLTSASSRPYFFPLWQSPVIS